MIYLRLFLEFFKTGLFSIGGGLATLPFLFQMSEKYGWFTPEQLTSMIAISESTPGPIGVNMATYVGYTVENLGVTGALCATLSLVLPSLIIILIIAGFLEKFSENKTVKNIFYALRPAVVGMLCVSLITIFKSTFLTNGFEYIISFAGITKIVLFAALTFLIFKFKKHPILYIAIGAASGIILGL